jgi:hypothetical protein
MLFCLDTSGQGWNRVKRQRFRVQLTYRQQLVLALMLVILLAISLLYCLGLASVALRQALENSPSLWSGAGAGPGDVFEPTVVTPGASEPQLTPTP